MKVNDIEITSYQAIEDRAKLVFNTTLDKIIEANIDWSNIHITQMEKDIAVYEGMTLHALETTSSGNVRAIIIRKLDPIIDAAVHQLEQNVAIANNTASNAEIKADQSSQSSAEVAAAVAELGVMVAENQSNSNMLMQAVAELGAMVSPASAQ